jgi:hypothetical protein
MSPDTRNAKNVSATPPPGETPFATVVGWTLIAFGVLPVLMGLGPDGRGYLVAGSAVVTLGAVLVGIGRVRARAGRTP